MNRVSSAGRVFAISAFLWLLINTAKADFIGLDIGASHWASPTPSSFDVTDSDRFDLIDDLDVDDPSQSSMTLILEHPITALPNIKYQGSQLNSDMSINGQALDSGTTYDLTHDDIALYYQLLDDGVNLDLGVDVKQLDGEVSFGGATDSIVSVDETIPLLYLSARFDLPLEGFYVGADINASVIDLGISESSAQDSTFILGYDSGNGLGLTGGFKYFSLDLNNVDAPDSEVEYDAIFFNGYVNF